MVAINKKNFCGLSGAYIGKTPPKNNSAFVEPLFQITVK